MDISLTTQPYSYVVLTIILYLIHKAFHKVNFLGFVFVSAILISLSSYMINYMHINQLTVMLTCILGYPLFSYLFSESIKGLKEKSRAPITMPYYPPYQQLGRQ